MKDTTETKDSHLETLQYVADKFGLGQIGSNVSNGRGFVNKTYEVETERGKFIFQKLAPIFNERITVDGLFLYGWLSARGFLTPRPLIAPGGALSVRYGHFPWRVSEYIENDPPAEKNYQALQSCALMLGKFHDMMSDCRYEPCFSIQGFHDTEQIVGLMMLLVREQKISGELAEIAKAIFRAVEKHRLPAEAETQLIHGDPKFDNFLFVGKRAVALVDFDTLMRGSVLLDLGDAMRSWCRRDGYVFDHNLFTELVEAYRVEYRPPFTRDQIRSAVALITLELAARYVTDAYHQRYFNWDETKYASSAEHNIARAKAYWEYYQSIVG